MPSLGLSMIVRNAERDLRLCLESARPAVDQIVIADTGSTDRTREIAAEYGATLVNFPWNDHFADARNAALEPVTTDWVLVLDADEELEPDAAQAIQSLLGASAGLGGYQVTIRNYIPDRFAMTFEGMSRVNHDRVPRAAAAPAYTEHRMVRLFRRHPKIRFARRIHEGVDEGVRSLGMRIGQANFLIRHFGHLAREADREKKRQYYLDLGVRKTAEHPGDALGWLELGSEYFNAEKYPEALSCMTRCFRLQPWALAALYIARIQAIEGHPAKALTTLDMVPDHKDLGLLRHELRGDLLHDLGRLREARLAYQAALRLSPCRRGEDPSGREANIESKLGYTEVRLGLVRMGLAKLRRAIGQMPDLIDNHDRLVKALVLLDRRTEAADAAERILRYFFSDKIYRRAAALRMRAGEPARAMELLEAGTHLFPGSRELAQLQSSIRSGRSEEPIPHPVAGSSAATPQPVSGEN